MPDPAGVWERSYGFISSDWDRYQKMQYTGSLQYLMRYRGNGIRSLWYFRYEPGEEA